MLGCFLHILNHICNYTIKLTDIAIFYKIKNILYFFLIAYRNSSYCHTIFEFFKYPFVIDVLGMRHKKSIFEIILFSAVLGMVFGGYSPIETQADEGDDDDGDDDDRKEKVKQKIRDWINKIRAAKRDGGQGNGTPVPESEVCFGKTVAEWRNVAGVTVIIGTDKNDRIKGTGKAEVIVSGAGRDRVSAAGGDDIVCLGDGDDVGNGGEGNDFIDGQDGDDNINAGGDDDMARGGAGEDTTKGGNGNDIIDAVDGEEDNINGGKPKGGSDTCHVDSLLDNWKSCELVIFDYGAIFNP